eukprot:763545-Hanusia_phi.AAC.3
MDDIFDDNDDADDDNDGDDDDDDKDNDDDDDDDDDNDDDVWDLKMIMTMMSGISTGNLPAIFQLDPNSQVQTPRSLFNLLMSKLRHSIAFFLPLSLLLILDACSSFVTSSPSCWSICSAIQCLEGYDRVWIGDR